MRKPKLEKKTANLNIMLTPEAKRSLQQKAEALGLSLTAYIEKVSGEDIIFMDVNLKSMLKAMELR